MIDRGDIALWGTVGTVGTGVGVIANLGLGNPIGKAANSYNRAGQAVENASLIPSGNYTPVDLSMFPAIPDPAPHGGLDQTLIGLKDMALGSLNDIVQLVVHIAQGQLHINDVLQIVPEATVGLLGLIIVRNLLAARGSH